MQLLYIGVYERFTYVPRLQADNSVSRMKFLVTLEKPTSNLKYCFAAIEIINCH